MQLLRRRVTARLLAMDPDPRLRAKGGSERTVEMLHGEVDRHLGDWLARPLAELTRQEVRRRHERVTRTAGPYPLTSSLRCPDSPYGRALRTPFVTMTCRR